MAHGHRQWASEVLGQGQGVEAGWRGSMLVLVGGGRYMCNAFNNKELKQQKEATSRVLVLIYTETSEQQNTRWTLLLFILLCNLFSRQSIIFGKVTASSRHSYHGN